MVQLKCDKCGRDIYPDTRCAICLNRHYDVKVCGRLFDWPNVETIGYDLCDECAKEIVMLIRGK